MNIKPLGAYALVELVEEENVSPGGGIILNVDPYYTKAKVLALGVGDKDNYKLGCRVGDTVLCIMNHHSEIVPGQKLVHPKEVVAVLEES